MHESSYYNGPTIANMAGHNSAIDLQEAASRQDMLSANKQSAMKGGARFSGSAAPGRRQRPMTAKVSKINNF